MVYLPYNMARDQKQKDKVLQARKDGASIRDLAHQFSIPKSTISYWCKDIVLSQRQIHNLQEKCRQAGSAKCIELGERQRKDRLKRIAHRYKEAAQEISHISDRDLHMIGLGLYWGEGYKKGSYVLGFTNSDPAIITVYLEWLYKIYHLTTSDITLRVSINQIHRSREMAVLTFWSTHTKIPLSQFTKTSFIKSHSKKEYTNVHTHFGTLRVKVKRSNTLFYHTMGSLFHISSLFDQKEN